MLCWITKTLSSNTMDSECPDARLRSFSAFVKNRIPVIAEDLRTSDCAKSVNDERNKGAFVMSAEATDINNLLSRSQNLACSKRKDGDK